MTPEELQSLLASIQDGRTSVAEGLEQLAGWPTLLTVLMAPLLIAQYVRVCLKEEADLDPEIYAAYRARVPMLL